jgi:Flp pilus assembly protein protease CpaA
MDITYPILWATNHLTALISWLLQIQTIVFLSGLGFLLYFSYKDITTGEVENSPILAFLMVGIVIVLYTGQFLMYWLVMLFMAILSYGMWRFKIMGGADVKVLVSIIPYLYLTGVVHILIGTWFFLIFFGIIGTIYGIAGKYILKEKSAPFLPAITFTYLAFWYIKLRGGI